ncbi:BTAD domain-containing putative transcriptional regulator [Streptomyces sparsogenes]|uniref:BTAD domain-containing putative transcriptional regulator n=1 Tax=Streptomyces sparsogenes TaxID=67365 RepID=UPI0033CB2B83
MRYALLGTTEAHRDDGTPVALGGTRLRVLLTVLALRPGRVHTTGALIGEIWDAGPPADGHGALQALVGRLRRALGKDAVRSVPGGYRLCADPDDVDLHRFERLVTEGTAALEDGDPAKAAAVLDDALALWRGPALADLPGAGSAAARAEARRLDARRCRIAADLALGHAERVLPRLAELCAAHPLDEPLHALRIRALRDAGRTAEALTAYEAIRREIADRLGADPGPALRALHADLLTPAPAYPAAQPGHPGRPSHPGRSGRPGQPGDLGQPGQPSHSGRPGDPGRSGRPSQPGDLGQPGQPGHSTRVGHPGHPGHPGPATGQPPAAPGGLTPGGSGAGGVASGGLASGGAVPDGSVPGDPLPVGPGRPAPADPASGGAPGQGGAARSGGNLRARLTSFVGRETDLGVLRADLAGPHRLVTLLGPGGAGKTRLSQEAAESVADAWPDGVWLAELAPVDDPGTVPEAVLTALGARQTVIRGTAAEELRAATDPTAFDPLAQLVDHCAPRRMLIVLDNCEHLVDAAARLAETLLTRCPGVTVLATSREPLAVPGELVRPVDPLPDPVALRLLQDRGAAARPGFRVADDPAACAEICRRLDGLPLAIELAAARLRVLTPRQLADRLDDRFRLLTSGSRTVLPRQQTLRAVVDWSWGLLDERERTVLRRLSVFAGGCDLAAAEAVCGDPDGDPDGTADGTDGTDENGEAAGTDGTDENGEAAGTDGTDENGEAAGTGGINEKGGAPGPQGVDPLDVAALLGSLVDKSLVVATPDATDGMRYRLLETVAEYAADRLEQAGERAAVERRHLVAYRELARTADPLLRGREQRRWLARLETEHDNLRAALRRAVAARDEQEALCLVLSLGWFWYLRGHRGEARQWSTAAAALGPNPFAPPVSPVAPLLESCTDRPPPMPPDVLDEARRGVRLLGLASIEGDLRGLGDEAAEDLQGIVRAYRPGLPQTCRVPGFMWFYAVLLTGRFALLREVVEQGVRSCGELGYEWEKAMLLQLRAKVLSGPMGAEVGRGSREALRDADESLEIFTRLGDAWGAAEALSGRGELLEQRGEGEAAAADYRAAIGWAEKLGGHVQVSLLRARLGGAMVESPDEAEAAAGERILRAVVEQGPHAGSEALSYARLQLALRCGNTGATHEARDQLERLLAEFGRRALGLFEGVVQGLIAWLDLVDGRPQEALVRVRGAIAKVDDPLAEMVAPHIQVTHVLIGAWTLCDLGGPERTEAAARLVGAYDALRQPHFRVLLSESAGRRRTEAALRARLGDAAYERAHAEGGGLSLEEATALV